MKKILSFLLVFTSFLAVSQTKLKLSQIEYAPGSGYCVTTNSLGVQTYTTKVSFLRNTVKSNTLTANYIPKALGGDSLGNSILFNSGSNIGIGTITPTVNLDIVNTNTNIAIFDNTRLARLKSSSVASLINFEGSGSSVSVGTSTSGSPCLFCVVNEADGNHLMKLQGGSANIIDGRATFESTSLQYSYIDTKNTQSWSSFGARLTQPFHIYDNISNKFMFSIDANGDIQLNQDAGKTYANKGLNLSNSTANTLIYSNGSKDLSSVTLGSGLSLTSGTLSATGSGSTTTITSGTNVSVTGTAPNYTVSSNSPTITAGNNMSVTTSGLNYTVEPVGVLTATNNLSDISNPLTARENLKHWDFYMTGGNVTTTSNVASNITGFVTPTLTANKRYRITGTIHTGCNNTGGVKIQVTIPTGCTISGMLQGSNVPNASSIAVQDISASATLSAAFNTANSALGHIYFMIDVQMSSTAGTIQFGFASGTNTQTSTIYQLGTFGEIEQLD